MKSSPQKHHIEFALKNILLVYYFCNFFLYFINVMLKYSKVYFSYSIQKNRFTKRVFLCWVTQTNLIAIWVMSYQNEKELNYYSK